MPRGFATAWLMLWMAVASLAMPWQALRGPCPCLNLAPAVAEAHPGADARLSDARPADVGNGHACCAAPRSSAGDDEPEAPSHHDEDRHTSGCDCPSCPCIGGKTLAHRGAPVLPLEPSSSPAPSAGVPTPPDDVAPGDLSRPPRS